jgi:oxygen-independent coproporphyrinogen-3 oxidase
LAYFVAGSIKERGFDHYEISNFGSYQSRHNQGYWKLDDYIGVGAGAVGFLKSSRYYPKTNIDSYIANTLEISREILTVEELLTERIFLGLRSTIGVDRNILPIVMQQRADLLVDKGMLSIEANLYQNPNFFLADEIALHLLR